MDAVASKRLKNKQHKYAAQGGLCYYCLEVMNAPRSVTSGEVHEDDATYEHIVPRSKGGIGRANNRVMVHLRCNIVHGRITSFLINIGKRSRYMDEFIEGACRVLGRECADYNDACQYVSEIIADVMEKYEGYTEREVSNQVHAELVRTFIDATRGNRCPESRMSHTD